MVSLSERLKLLGVSTSHHELIAPKKKISLSIERIIPGDLKETAAGDIYYVENRYPHDFMYGRTGLQIDAKLDTLAEWVGRKELSDFTSPSFAFLDTESTGLSGGTGTYAFLIGAGRIDKDGFHLIQYFMRDPIEEPSQLLALEEFLAPCQAIVTFNGKAFDIPLLNTRYIFHGWQSPLDVPVHIDLLHLARRLWKDRISSRTLSNLEAKILGALRSEEDIPGWMVPSYYFNYLRDGDARPLRHVFYHNRMDVLSLAALLNYMTGLLSDPLISGDQYGTDLIALGRLFEDMGDINSATNLYFRGLEHDDVKKQLVPQFVLINAIQRLANIYKRQRNFHEAVALWEQAVRHHSIDSFIELAKYYEHNKRDYIRAIGWTQSALDIIHDDIEHGNNKSGLNPYKLENINNELLHRLNRLLLKKARNIPE